MTHFNWRGQPIPDIRAWAEGRGERMVPYRASREVPSAITGRIEHEEYEAEMPESFWGNLQMSGGWCYVEIA